MARRSANLSLDGELLDEAKALAVNLSRSAEEGIRLAVARARAERWRVENAEAVEGYNRLVAERGLPLGRFRGF